MVAIVAGIVVLVALACSDTGPAPDPNIIARGDPIPVTPTPIDTATPEPRATLWSPMEVTPGVVEGWTAYAKVGNATIATAAAPYVTDQCWQWIATPSNDA